MSNTHNLRANLTQLYGYISAVQHHLENHASLLYDWTVLFCMESVRILYGNSSCTFLEICARSFPRFVCRFSLLYGWASNAAVRTLFTAVWQLECFLEIRAKNSLEIVPTFSAVLSHFHCSEILSSSLAFFFSLNLLFKEWRMSLGFSFPSFVFPRWLLGFTLIQRWKLD